MPQSEIARQLDNALEPYAVDWRSLPILCAANALNTNGMKKSANAIGQPSLPYFREMNQNTATQAASATGAAFADCQ